MPTVYTAFSNFEFQSVRDEFIVCVGVEVSNMKFEPFTAKFIGSITFITPPAVYVPLASVEVIVICVLLTTELTRTGQTLRRESVFQTRQILSFGTSPCSDGKFIVHTFVATVILPEIVKSAGGVSCSIFPELSTPTTP